MDEQRLKTRPEGVSQPESLLQLLEEYFDLPSQPVEFNQTAGGALENITQQFVGTFFLVNDDPPQ